ncbi:MAG: cyclic pyranopterin monophosphate synthase MoaC [Opitutae bacterium]|nr:cyclic pyranopterin monophosphate synthase MoaC [Opitutae bacterium]
MLTHLDKKNRPQMVDISEKKATERTATARTLVEFPSGLLPDEAKEEIQTKKGPVFQTAIIAGTQAIKRTADLIPFCHPLPLDSIGFSIRFLNPTTIQVECTVKTTHKTGVEMEALTGVSVAALTIYDMCKSLSHGIVIGETRLLKKTGGKADFCHED